MNGSMTRRPMHLALRVARGIFGAETVIRVLYPSSGRLKDGEDGRITPHHSGKNGGKGEDRAIPQSLWRESMAPRSHAAGRVPEHL